MSVRFKNRIALFNTIAASLGTLVVFIIVYFVVKITSFHHLDADITAERKEILEELQWVGDSIPGEISGEWGEKEHQQTEVNPTFLQINDAAGRLRLRSANLGYRQLSCDISLLKPHFSDTELGGKQIRQGQFALYAPGGKHKGFLLIATSRVESALVLHNLRITLLLAYFFLVILFYAGTSLAAARGIAPIHDIIHSARGIDDQNIQTRLPLPPIEDELHQLASTINDLLQRLETSLKREKQITADVSHELRSPLAGIRGTLEVLLRKKREPEHYEQKIEQVIEETERMNRMFDQLMQLAKLEAGYFKPHSEAIQLSHLMHHLKEVWQPVMDAQEMAMDIDVAGEAIVNTDARLLELIIGNLISNALKYGASGRYLGCSWDEMHRTLSIADRGPGIQEENLPYIFDRFYRTDASRSMRVPGAGLGLSLAKRLADLLHISLSVSSRVGAGTTFRLQFPI